MESEQANEDVVDRTSQGSETDMLGEEEVASSETVRRSNIYYLCLSHLLSKWGDRMWMFSIGLFLVEIGCGSLLLPAVSGLAVALSVVLFGSMVGDWVDRNARLKVVKLTLFIENGLVIVSSAILTVFFLPQLTGSSQANEVEDKELLHQWIYILAIVALVILAAAANLASTATTIAVERDWIVVITHKDENELAGANAKLRRIDLACKILAPVPVSLIMNYSLWIAALFIAIWNIISVVIEYALLLKIYHRVPQLAIKDLKTETKPEAKTVTKSENVVQEGEEGYASDEEDDGHEQPRRRNFCVRFMLKLLTPYRNLIGGWKTYRRQTAFRAGMALGLLYLTVLGFNSVTTGYLYTQGLVPWQISIAQAIAAFMGIAGTFVYPKLRRRVGLVRSGLMFLTWEWLCILLPAASVFVPGNPTRGGYHYSVCDDCNMTTPTQSPGNMSSYLMHHAHNISTNCSTDDQNPLSTALFLFLVGTLASRIGLWGFDCAVTQTFQETVAPNERGIVGGVQKVLNSNMDMLHFVLVIAMPHANQFGYLILVSVAMVGLGLILYATYSRSVRGHLFHFDIIMRPCRQKRMPVAVGNDRDKEILLSSDDDTRQDVSEL